jgi:chaperonin GroES
VLTLPDNKVACEPLYDPDESTGGIIIPDMAKERCDQGIVKYTGSKVTLVQPGDHVLFSGYTGTFIEVQYEGRLIIMPEDFITCIIHDDPTDVAGLYFRSKSGEYFQATYEQVTILCARTLERYNKVKPSRLGSKLDGRPSPEDYARLR